MERTIRILVAEADPAFVQMVEDSMTESGTDFDIVPVPSGAGCLDALQRGHFHILLLDHKLPDGEGLDWLRRINRMGIGVPTIFVTAQGDPRLAIEAMREGVFDYINRSAECAKAFPFVVNRAVKGHTLMQEKVRLQKELIETKNFLELVLEKAGDAISVVDREGRIIYWNEGAKSIYGYGKEEVLGRNPSDFLYPRNETSRAEEARLHETWMARVEGGEVVSNVEVRRSTKDGKEIITSMTLSPLRDAEGRVVGAIRICKDITQLKKAEERLFLAERLSSLGELTAGVAHELRNPLSGIKLNTQILARKKDLADVDRRLLDSTQEGIEKIQKLIEDMLHFAKPKAAHFREEDMNALLEKCLSILQGKLNKAEIRAVFQPCPGLPAVLVDPHQMQQVLVNLMLNAIQAMGSGGTLTIRTSPDGDGSIRVEIADTGEGISRAHLKRIFDPFFTTKSEGTGLGLSISLKILENHGATVEVASSEGEGSTFTLRLPRRVP